MATTLHGIWALSITTVIPVHAQTIDDESYNEDIVVTAERLRGSLITKVPPIVELDAEYIASYGFSSEVSFSKRF